MYIRSFHMDGFGVYADVTVENLTPGLTIFLGENEAGKSTCMEFLRTMLTGYPDPRSRDARSIPGPLRGGQAGGGLVLQAADAGVLHLTRRPGAGGGVLTLADDDGAPLEQELLRRLLNGVSREVYRKVFGFSLSELEDLNNLTEEEVRAALYGASFGPGLRSPGEAVALLDRRAEEIFKSGGSKPPLNQALRQLTELRRRKSELEQASAGYDSLAQDLEACRSQLAAVRGRRQELEEQRRLLERRLGAWRQWNEWRMAGVQLERLTPASSEFPEDGRPRLARAQEARAGCERQWAAQHEKLARLRQRRDAVELDRPLLEALPELRRLAERKSGFRQALSDQPLCEEALCRAGEELRHALSQLGPDWTCERIRATDRSLFAREDLERQAGEMQTAASAQQAAVDSLNLCNHSVEQAEIELAAAEESLSLLPAPEAELDAEARDGLRQALARQEEARRQRTVRLQALREAQTTFARAYDPLRLSVAGAEGTAGSALDALLAEQEKALSLAGEVCDKVGVADEAAQAVRQAEEQAADIKTHMDALREEQRVDGISRSDLDMQAVALRKLRALAATLETERERHDELEARIANEPSVSRIRSLPLLLVGILIFLCGAAMLVAVWQLGPLTIPLHGALALPVDMWSGYLLLLCGVGFLAGGLPHNGAEARRRQQELLRLQSRRDACALHVQELEEQARQLRDEADVDSMDLVTLEAREVLLEHQREQCFHEERTRKEMDALRKNLDAARNAVAERQAACSEAETVVQRARRRWHEFMLGQHVSNVPSPEGAQAFFARVEAARLAFGALAAAEAEVRTLDELLDKLEARIRSLPAVAERLTPDADADALAAAARQVLESCREADAMRDQRIKAEAALQNARNELRRAGQRQAEAREELARAQERLEKARAEWRKALGSLGLGENLAPETVREAFKHMETCLATESALGQARTRLTQIRAELAALSAPLEALFQRLGREPETDAEQRPDWLLSLDSLQRAAEEMALAQSRRAALDNAVVEAEDECRAAEVALESAREAERALLALAGAGDAEEFLRQAALHEEREALLRRRQDLEDALRLAAAQTPWEEFLAAFEAEAQETQERRLSDLETELESARARDEALAQRVAELAARVDSLASGEELPALQQQEADLLEAMERMAYDWSRLALARTLLDAARRNFERERQPEVIKQASRIFARITGGRWRGIGARLDDASLVMLPEQGEPVQPEKLSRGTREQAYLALRLAYVTNHAAHAEPLPLIMDEVLVNFDPGRAERTARAFVELTASSGGNAHQLFYFTCHPHMVDLLRHAEPHAALFTVADGSIRAA